MTKISQLPALAVADVDGEETLPAVKNGVMVRIPAGDYVGRLVEPLTAAVAMENSFHRLGGIRRPVVGKISAPGGVDFAIFDDRGDVYVPDLKFSFSQMSAIDERIKTLVDASGRPISPYAAIAMADYRFVDLVMVAGDSHQLFGGNGMFWAFTQVLGTRYTIYATQFARAGGSPYSPAGQGGYFSGTGITASGAPAALEALRFPDLAGPNSPADQTMTYGWLADGVVSAATSTEMAISVVPFAGAPTAVDVRSAWRGDYWLGTFPTEGYAGAGTTTLAVRTEGPYATLATKTFTSKTGAYGRTIASVTAPANPARTAALGFKFRLQGQNAIGPMLAYGARALNLSAKKGISVHSLDARGGQSFYDMAYQAKNFLTDQQAIDYFSAIRKYQVDAGLTPIVILAISSGHNDPNEQLQPSLGYRASTTGNSAPAYVDNAQVLIKRYRDIWKMAGWDETELYFIVYTSQRRPGTGALDPQMQAYGQICEPTLAGQARVAYVQMENLTTAAESASYPNDGVHYTTVAGYLFLANRVATNLIPNFTVVPHA